MTLLIDTSPPSIARAALCLREGGLVAFPTETVYGLGAHALDVPAIRRLFAAKGRPFNDPLIVHLASFDDVASFVAGDARVGPYAIAERLAQRFWPGPLTLVLPKSASVPPEVTAGLDTVAVRVPSHPIARALLQAARIPVAAPSANLFSRPSPTRAEHVLQDLDGRIDIVIDGGATTVGVESTVLDLTLDPPTVLRPGVVTLEQLRELIPRVTARRAHAAGDAPPASPGLFPEHYAPRAPLTLYEGPRALERLAADAMEAAMRRLRVGLLLPAEDAFRFGGPMITVALVGHAADPASVAARLYAALRELDGAGVDIILARTIAADEGLGTALLDRLRRAAAGRIVHT